jgi:hypothetical protein
MSNNENEKVELYNKLFNAKSEIGQISKNKTNPFHKSEYFDVNGLIEAVEPILQKHKLLLIQPLIDNQVVSIISDIETGFEISSSIEIRNQDNPQKIGSEITYYRRYTLQSLLGLKAEDDDANKASVNKPKDDKQWLNPTDLDKWSKAVDYVAKGGSVVDIRKRYKLSKENEQKLTEQSKNK